MFKWEKEYEYGIEFVDTEHKKLFEIGRKVYDLYKNQLILDKYDKILDLVQELKEYTEYHFNHEEEYMKEIGYKQFFSHKCEHMSFIEGLDTINYSDIDDYQDGFMEELITQLSDWLIDHILVKDKGFVDYVRNK